MTLEASKNAVLGWIDWCKSTGTPVESVAEHIAADVILAASTASQPDANGWLPIESLPEGRHVELYWPRGEKGGGGVETAMVFIDDGEWSYWTHGGPNSGSDWEPRDRERPTHWRPYTLPVDAQG